MFMNSNYITICSLIKAALDSSSFELTEWMPDDVRKHWRSHIINQQVYFEMLEIERRSAGL